MGIEGKLTFWRTVGRGLRLRCPVCGQGRLFKSFFTMETNCPSCGLDLRREQGYYVGAMYINYGVTAAVMLGVGIPMAMRGFSLPQISWPLGAFAVAFPIVFFRWSKGLWLGIDLYITSLIPK
jgi:uncharacterized protein (DUF983 family)